MSLALKLMLSPVLVAQAMSIRRRVPVLPEAAGPREGQLGSGGRTVRLLIAGDSSAAGELVEFLSEWLRGHMAVADRMMSARLRNYLRFNTSLAS